jgi:hypothetical protein
LLSKELIHGNSKNLSLADLPTINNKFSVNTAFKFQRRFQTNGTICGWVLVAVGICHIDKAVVFDNGIVTLGIAK